LASTSATTVASTIRTKYYTKLLKTAKQYLVQNRFASSKAVSGGEGDSVRVNRLLRPAIQETASTAGTMITESSAKALSSNYQDLSMEIWGDSFAWNEDVDITSFIADKDNRDVIGRQMAQSLDYQMSKKWATQCMRYRCDTTATNYQIAGTVDQSTVSCSTTVFGIDNTTAVGTDTFNGGYLTITNASGANYDITKAITDTVDDSHVVTGAFPQTHAATSKGWAVVGTGLADTASTTHLLKVSAMHEKMETEKFPRGLYRCFMAPEVHLDLMQDTTFLQSVVYDEAYHLGTYQLGRIFDIEFLVTSNCYRESVAGAEGRGSGAVFVTPIFGTNCRSVFSFANPGGTGQFSVKFIPVEEADSSNLRQSKRFLSWKGVYAAGVTRATSVIGLMTGASDLEVLV